MLWIIFYTLNIFLIIIGFVDVFGICILSIINKSKDNSKSITLIPIHGHNEEIEFLLRDAATKIEWVSNKKNHQYVICVDLGMDDETKKIAYEISSKYKFMNVCTFEELENVLVN